MVKFLCWTKRVGHREAFVVCGAKEAILPQREVINWLNYFYTLGYTNTIYLFTSEFRDKRNTNVGQAELELTRP